MASADPDRRRAFRPVPTDGSARLDEHRRYPLCRVVVTCTLCGWAKGYNPERLISRLRQLKGGGDDTKVADVARRVAWPCPMCGRVKWRSELAWPAAADPREIRRLTAMIRN